MVKSSKVRTATPTMPEDGSFNLKVYVSRRYLINGDFAHPFKVFPFLITVYGQNTCGAVIIFVSIKPICVNPVPHDAPGSSLALLAVSFFTLYVRYSSRWG